ncbi:hypothetical protein AAFF_G00347270 [Aldrovandia affinis]|uniref:Uncharacterized protein n=1 Tax=Aldrovandia affinis TaxID=143900 RepID=A0AAD7WPR7_9TELE|nr:hypothetical protein AAFF_G00347270 [Aldrovandia affinis]
MARYPVAMLVFATSNKGTVTLNRGFSAQRAVQTLAGLYRGWPRAWTPTPARRDRFKFTPQEPKHIAGV